MKQKIVIINIFLLLIILLFTYSIKIKRKNQENTVNSIIIKQTILSLFENKNNYEKHKIFYESLESKINELQKTNTKISYHKINVDKIYYHKKNKAIVVIAGHIPNSERIIQIPQNPKNQIKNPKQILNRETTTITIKGIYFEPVLNKYYICQEWNKNNNEWICSRDMGTYLNEDNLEKTLFIELNNI